MKLSGSKVLIGNKSQALRTIWVGRREAPKRKSVPNVNFLAPFLVYTIEVMLER